MPSTAESDEFDAEAAAAALTAMAADVKSDYKLTYELQDEENLSVSDETATGADVLSLHRRDAGRRLRGSGSR